VSYAFSPTQAGAATGTSSIAVEIYAGEQFTGDSQDATIALSGTGLAPLAISTGSLAFGDATVGSTAPAQVVTLTNTTAAAVSFQITGGGVASGGFTGSVGACGSAVETLQPGASCASVSYAFTPTQTGAVTGTSSIAVEIYAGGAFTGYSQDQAISLTGSGVGPGPHLLVTPDGLNLGAAPVGVATAGLTALVRDTGTVTLTGLTVAAATGSGFSATSTCPSSLAPGASCTVTYVLTPTAQGAASGSDTVSAAAGDAQVTLTGSGTATR
jgi:hypothetical protein